MAAKRAGNSRTRSLSTRMPVRYSDAGAAPAGFSVVFPVPWTRAVGSAAPRAGVFLAGADRQ